MSKRYSRRLALAGLIVFGSMLLAAAPSVAATPVQIDLFMSDVRAHMQMCDKVSPDKTDLIQKCANEKTALIQRQHDLGLTYAQVNDRLKGDVKTRGWRWQPPPDAPGSTRP